MGFDIKECSPGQVMSVILVMSTRYTSREGGDGGSRWYVQRAQGQKEQGMCEETVT